MKISGLLWVKVLKKEMTARSANSVRGVTSECPGPELSETIYSYVQATKYRRKQTTQKRAGLKKSQAKRKPEKTPFEDKHEEQPFGNLERDAS